jgi:hypothetical protein
MTVRTLAPALLLVGCSEAPAEEAPPTLESQSLLALQRFYEDDAGEQMATLVDLLEDEISDDPAGYFFDPLTADDVDMYEHTDDVDWSRTGGAAALARMRGDFSGYTASVLEPDQSFADGTYEVWSREIVGGDPDEFLVGGNLETSNHIEKNGAFGIMIPYDMFKDYRWSTHETFGDVLSFISLVPESGFDDSGENGIVVGFTIELWYVDDGGLVWYNGSWSQLKTAVDDLITDPAAFKQELVDGTLDYFWGTEEHVTGSPHE